MFLCAYLDVSEETAKFRAARRLWAKILTGMYGMPEERARMRIFCSTPGGALTAQQPHNNIIRAAHEPLAAALGSVQILATSSWNEVHSLPSSGAAHPALRTQRILAFEPG